MTFNFDFLACILDKLAKEESYLVVSAVSQVISALERFIDEGTETEKAFNNLVAKLFAQKIIKTNKNIDNSLLLGSKRWIRC